MQRWLIARARAHPKRNGLYIYACVFRGIVTGWSNESGVFYLRIVSTFFSRSRSASIYHRLGRSARAHTGRGHVSYRNFCASEFCVWMFNGGFRMLLFTMATDLIKRRARCAFRAVGMELEHASARLHHAVPHSCIFWSRVSCFLTELRVILNLYFRCIDSADW